MESGAENDSVDIGTLNVADAVVVPSGESTPRTERRRPPALNLRHTSSYDGPISPTKQENYLHKATRSPGLLTRSNTLPRNYLKTPSRESPAHSVLHEVPSLQLESDTISKLSSWLVCVALVHFDLDHGPSLLGVFPPVEFSSSDRENISFSSFPDSAQFKEGSSVHSFRFRWSPEQSFDNEQTLASDGFIYGFSYFSRRKDKSSARGYDQRSIVLLTLHPWPSFFTEFMHKLGPMYMEHGAPMLESACHNVASWYLIFFSPVGGALTIVCKEKAFPETWNVEQFQNTDTSSFGEKFSLETHILSSMAPPLPSPLNAFAASITHMWSLWECLVLCDPVIVFGTSSSSTSQAVWWLWDILRPIPNAIDFRPYFTIHDKDYAAIIKQRTPGAGLLVGVTNPLFSNLCEHWPHRLSLGRKSDTQSNSNFAGPSPGWITKTHNRYISKDRELLARLENAVKTKGPIDADGRLALALRQHFTTRMVQFLVPLNRYLNTLIPAPAVVNTTKPGQSVTRRSLKPFNHDHFMTSLKTHGSPLPFRSTSKRKEFYERWLRTPSFGIWLAKQDETISAFLQKADEEK